MLKIATLGCSHSSDIWGLSWADWLAKSLNKELLRAASPGAGNAFYLEKLHAIIKQPEVDLIVIQLTSPERIVLGSTYQQKNIEGYNSGYTFNSIGCQTWTAYHNNEHILKNTGEDINIDKIWAREVAFSNWVYYKFNQDIALMQLLCDQFNKKCIFWSWFIPMENAFAPEYNWLKRKISWVPGCSMTWLKKEFPFAKTDNGHYDSEAHRKLTEEWLFPEIKKFI